MHISRRRLMGGAVVLGSGALLAACAGQTAQQIAQTVLTDAADVTNGLANAAVGLKAVGNVPASVLTAITTDAQNAATAASGLSASMTQTQAQPVISQIQADTSAFMKDLGTFVSNPAVSSIISDVQIVLPILLAAVGMVVPAGAASSSSDVASARARLAALPKASLH